MVEHYWILFEYLAKYGGKIVCTSSLEIDDINQARASNRMYVDSWSIGYVWIPNLTKFPESEEEVVFFEKWYPLKIEIPNKDDMFNKIINRCEAKKINRQKLNISNIISPLFLRSEKIFLLEKYSLWLTNNGYMDTDWKDEEPFAIDEFLKQNDCNLKK